MTSRIGRVVSAPRIVWARLFILILFGIKLRIRISIPYLIDRANWRNCVI